jgi:serine/threonine-protein kinase
MLTATDLRTALTSVTAVTLTDPLHRLLEGEATPRRGLGLSTRIFLGVTALLVTTLGVAIAVASWQAGRAAEARIAADLQAVPAIYEGYVDSQIAARRAQLRSLADQPGSKALLAESYIDPTTLHDSAVELAGSLGARITFLFDARGALLARSDQPDGEEAGRSFADISWVATPLGARESASAFILDVRTTPGLYLLTSTPVLQGLARERRVNGVIAGAFQMNRARAQEVARVTGADVAFLASFADRSAAPDPRIVAATDALAGAWLAGVRAANPAFARQLFVDGRPFGPFEFSANDERYIGTAMPILSSSGEPIGAVVVAHSKSDELTAFNQVRLSLLLTGLGVLLPSLPLSLLVARRIARPIRQLAHGAEQIGRGQLDVTLPAVQGGEVGSLARAFEGMVAELREKAQLEAAMASLLQSGHTPAPIVAPAAASAADGASDGAPRADDDAGVTFCSSGLIPGTRFAGRYEIVSVLGEGGMGSVYRTRDRELDDDVALKCLRQELGSDAATAALLKEEIKLARMITHVNVVRVYDVGEAEGRRFFTMEYVRGQTLRELIDRSGGGLPVTPALQIAKQVCRGLAAVHKAGIVHGDLKPQNVMVLPNGVAKLMDFGVARVRTRRGAAQTVGGTPLYMSPEQGRGAEIDDRSDIYAAGLLMFELFTGQPPFLSQDVVEIARMHQHDRPPNPRLLRPDLPETLSRIILGCLEKSHLQRPATASDLDRLLMRVRA